jgi:hypothetical protein
MELEGSLPFSQANVTDPSPEPDESSPHPPPSFPKNHFNIILPPYA